VQNVQVVQDLRLDLEFSVVLKVTPLLVLSNMTYAERRDDEFFEKRCQRSSLFSPPTTGMVDN